MSHLDSDDVFPKRALSFFHVLFVPLGIELLQHQSEHTLGQQEPSKILCCSTHLSQTMGSHFRMLVLFCSLELFASCCLAWERCSSSPALASFTKKKFHSSFILLECCFYTVFNTCHIFVPQDFGAGEARSSLQPGCLPVAVHTPKICHSPREQQPDHYWDRPQCLHWGHQGTEEATNGWGNWGGGQVHLSVPQGRLLQLEVLPAHEFSAAITCKAFCPVWMQGLEEEWRSALTQISAECTPSQYSFFCMLLGYILRTTVMEDSLACVTPDPTHSVGFLWLVEDSSIWVGCLFSSQDCFQDCWFGETAPQTTVPWAGQSWHSHTLSCRVSLGEKLRVDGSFGTWWV